MTLPSAPRLPSPRGRPRDPRLEARVFDAALQLYGAEGWSGFSFEVIARAAGVGKASLYRRWPTKGDLLRELLRERWVAVDQIDTGSFRADMRALCDMLFTHLAGPLGAVGYQLQLDSARHEDVAEAVSDYAAEVERRARAMVRRAIARGEVPPGTSPALVLEIASGAVTIHVSATPAAMRRAMMDNAEAWLDSLVALVCRGVGIAAP